MSAQESVSITGAGTGKGGSWLVNVKVNLKSVNKSTEDVVMQAAVEGVMFNGFMSTDGSLDQKPLIKDAGVKTTKADFFKSFDKECAYRRYAAVVPGTLTIMKNKQLKCKEVSANVLINQDSLRKYLEENGIITGFSNLW